MPMLEITRLPESTFASVPVTVTLNGTEAATLADGETRHIDHKYTAPTVQLIAPRGRSTTLKLDAPDAKLECLVATYALTPDGTPASNTALPHIDNTTQGGGTVDLVVWLFVTVLTVFSWVVVKPVTFIINRLFGLERSTDDMPKFYIVNLRRVE